MAETLVAHFRDLMESLDIPSDDTITDEAIERFETGLDILLMYRGDPDVLVQSLRTFISTQVRPLVYAGAAHVVIAASYVSGKKFDEDGLKYARLLHDRAANHSWNSFHVALLDVALLGEFKQLDKMRSALDSVREHYVDTESNISYILAEMNYWEKRSNIPEFERWANLGLEHARNNIHRLNVLNRLAGTYLMLPKAAGYKEALAYYERVVSIDSEDPWAWHNMSIIHRYHGDLEKAFYCNYRALEIMPFGNAFEVLRTLVERFAKQRHKDPIQEVVRYPVASTKPPLRFS